MLGLGIIKTNQDKTKQNYTLFLGAHAQDPWTGLVKIME